MHLEFKVICVRFENVEILLFTLLCSRLKVGLRMWPVTHTIFLLSALFVLEMPWFFSRLRTEISLYALPLTAFPCAH